MRPGPRSNVATDTILSAYMRTKKHLSATLFLLVLPRATGSAVPLTSPVTVLYHEPLVLLSDQAARVQDDAGRTVSFDAFGRRFELQLDNHRKLNRQRTNSNYELFKGKLAGIPRSWVRLMRQGDEISGMIATEQV